MSFQDWYATEGRDPAMPQIAVTTEPREPEPSPPFGVPLLVIEVLDRWDMGPTQRRCRVRCRAEDGFDGVVTVMDDLDVGEFFRLADPMAPRELAVEDDEDDQPDEDDEEFASSVARPHLPVTFEPFDAPGGYFGLGGWEDFRKPRGPALPATRVGDDGWEIACRCPSCGLMVSWYQEEHLGPDGTVRPRRLVGLSTPTPAASPEVLDAMPLRSILVEGDGPQRSVEPPPKVLRVGTPMGFHLRGDLIEALARCARCSRAVGVLTCQVTIGASTAQRES